MGDLRGISGESIQQHQIRVPFDDDTASRQLCDFLDTILVACLDRPLVIVCVGTDRSTGDAFGPIVGTKLRSISSLRDIHVYGTLDEPVHAVNLSTTLEHIYSTHGQDAFILAVDACLGKFDHVGHIILEHGPLRPGAGVKKSLPVFGEYTLTGVVNVCGFMEYFVLQNTRLSIVMRMADVVVQSLNASLHRLMVQRNMATQRFHLRQQH